MADHPSPKPTGADPDPQKNDSGLDPALRAAAQLEEALGHWVEDPADDDDTDPEHSRRLAAIRTELLRRSRPHQMRSDTDE